MTASGDEVFLAHRAALLSIAYNMLGRVAEAEDCVQEAYLRWQRASRAEDGEAIASPQAYLRRVVANLCINRLQSAAARRESYVGVWLPEPLVEREATPPGETAAEQSETLSIALLRVMESLTPVERAVFLLREVFERPYPEISRAVGKSEAHCRQLVHRAKERLALGQSRFSVSSDEHERLALRFAEACASDDVHALVEVLASDVTLYSDGGEAREPIHHADAVARFILAGRERLSQGSSWSWRITRVNGKPGVVILVDSSVYAVFALEVRAGRIDEVDIIVSPSKLRHLQA
ncbi:RNA polymerase sigma factor SigJ [Pyxidicoccus sp. MSG2]|uniref:RNA polymerase sigma factor SigJ n=1 Tax=Pyxidicoccus sp. MSG2 TaxID=2996790 RepID=UPI00226F6198|nr:RNA polymerase sigma factor SigJ [Pyxidicoccus sp. MSG2]MCY1017721.1 RNA polymerase sigma factor SigJ [Pyxidicoccus sp. MSG2]